MIIPEAIEDKTTHKWYNKGATKNINKKTQIQKWVLAVIFFYSLYC